MKAKDRVKTALKLEEPDRLPTFEWIINPDIIENMTGQRSDIVFVSEMDIDGVVIVPSGRKEIIDDRHYRDEWGVVRVSYDEYPNPVEFPVKTEKDFEIGRASCRERV